MISLKQAQIDVTICKIEWNLVAVDTTSFHNVYMIQRVFQSPNVKQAW